jgi:hypothetical protein
MPKEIASWIAGRIKNQADDSARLQMLLDFANLGDEQHSRDVVAQLGEYLPFGYNLVLDIADPLHSGNSGDKVLAAKVLGELSVNTDGVELPQETQDLIPRLVRYWPASSGQAHAINDDLGAVTDARMALARAATQIAKAKFLADTTTTQGKNNTEEFALARESVAELTNQYTSLYDPKLINIYYPSAIEVRSPGAIREGLAALRKELADAELKAQPGADANGDAAAGAIWVNHRSGFALVQPSKQIEGTERTPAARILTFVTMDEAEQRGLQSLMKKKREVDDYWQFKNFNPFQNSPQQP